MASVTETLHRRRVTNEFEFLECIAATNSGVVALLDRSVHTDSAHATIEIAATPGLIFDGDRLQLETCHKVDLHFPRFFPAVPIEARLVRPVLHPNVDPQNGFVCLWESFSEQDTSIEAVTYLRNMIAWRMFNLHAAHVLQPGAVSWYQDPDRGFSIPFDCPELYIPVAFGSRHHHPLQVLAKKPRIIL